MALYLVKSNDPGEITVLVRARNGDHARELAGYPDGWVSRLTEDGEAGVVWPPATSEEPAPKPKSRRRKVVDVTNLSDPPGTRRYKDLDSGEESVEDAD